MANMELTERIQSAKGRSNIYDFLTTVYRIEFNAERLQGIKDPAFAEVLSEFGVDVNNAFFNGTDEKVIEDLAVEYARLFAGPGKHISPHESVHHERDGGDWGKLWGRSTIDVKMFIEKAGLEFKSEYTGLPDHISVEFEFMKELTLREAQAWEENDSEGAMKCREIEKRFVDDHISKWVPGFCDRVIQTAELDFYRNIAKLTKEYVLEEKGLLDENLLFTGKDDI